MVNLFLLISVGSCQGSFSTVSFLLHESVIVLVVNNAYQEKGCCKIFSWDHASPKTSRPSRRTAQPPVAQKKVTDLIASSSKKQKPGNVPYLIWNCFYVNVVI